MSGLLAGKHIVVTGVLTDQSLAYGVAELAQQEGADIVLTGAGRGLALTKRIARKLPEPPPVLELDVTEPSHLSAVAADLQERWGVVDGILHAIGFAPPGCLGGGFLEAPWEDVSVALHISTYSLKALAAGLLPLMRAAGGASVVGLDFDATVAWPVYDWMGVAKAGLEAVSRYLARDVGPRGVRVNLVSAGPIETLAAGGIPGFEQLASTWGDIAPLGWDTGDASCVAGTVCFLLSELSRGVTGEIIHVDGGYHAMGAPIAARREPAVAGREPAAAGSPSESA
jgi:enoyl-[acyl-carrier protein] reductase I